MIRRAADTLGVRHIVLAGSSGGGFAALQVASFLPEAVVVAMSPQTDLRQYSRRLVHSAVEPALGIADISRSSFDSKRLSVLERYAAAGTFPRVELVSNPEDKVHVKAARGTAARSVPGRRARGAVQHHRDRSRSRSPFAGQRRVRRSPAHSLLPALSRPGPSRTAAVRRRVSARRPRAGSLPGRAGPSSPVRRSGRRGPARARGRRPTAPSPCSSAGSDARPCAAPHLR